MKRTVSAELLDDDLGTPDEIASSLRDLRRINTWFGGTQLTARLLRRVAGRTGLSRLSVLEVGSGLGDVPLAAQRSLAKSGMQLDVTLVDRRASHLPASSVRRVAANALHLPFRNASFDVVSCTLFAHHFEPQALILFVVEALRVARHAVVMNDVVRNRLHLTLVYLGFPLYRSRLTRNDAPASVRQAYTIEEMRLLLAKVPSRRVVISRRYLFRMGVLIWK